MCFLKPIVVCCPKPRTNHHHDISIGSRCHFRRSCPYIMEEHHERHACEAEICEKQRGTAHFSREGGQQEEKQRRQDEETYIAEKKRICEEQERQATTGA
ncbi:hypothetical protein L3Y34_013724 [Caenorhabditis briggsae]|uniref:Uncharacterized protein n=1 Tax=Caenorhabditis briggsae TaxID=6238 RepID=A0AAE9CXC7_CAEBR|nr:hypothetical protein L3Y34_013724 [Caenorhabditis briggsae]